MIKEMIQIHNSAHLRDCPPKPIKIKKLTIIFIAFGIVLYFSDVVSDICLAIRFYRNGQLKYFYMTLFLVILSSLASSVYSLYMYYSENKKEELKVTVKHWILRVFFLLFGIAPVLKNFYALYFAWKSCCSENKTKKKEYAKRMLYEINDLSFLKMFEAFIESGPQLVLQIYIFAQTQAFNPNVFSETEIYQCFSMFTSAVSISHTFVSYLNSIQNNFDFKEELKWYQLTLIFLWRFFEITSRVLAMGLGIAATPYFHIAFFMHFIIMIVWIYLIRFGKPNFSDTPCKVRMFDHTVRAVLSIFVFFNAEKLPTQRRCMLFYLLIFIENTSMVVYWFYFCSPVLHLKFPALVMQLSFFCLSMIFMVIYYKYFHPVIGKLSIEKMDDSGLRTNAPENVQEDGEVMVKTQIT